LERLKENVPEFLDGGAETHIWVQNFTNLLVDCFFQIFTRFYICGPMRVLLASSASATLKLQAIGDLPLQETPLSAHTMWCFSNSTQLCENSKQDHLSANETRMRWGRQGGRMHQ
jgi:hypothetical protein